MLISYEWLKTFFDKELPGPDEISEKLIFHSFEVEGVDKEGDDTVFDIDVLPNRGHDALCHRGIAKDVSALFVIPFRKDPLLGSGELTPESNSLEVTIEDSKNCRRFTGSVIRGVEVKESPDWLKNRLEVLGQKSINNVVDATNYVMFSIGQPLHAFDMDKLEQKDGGAAINVRGAKNGEKINTLDGGKHELDKTMQVISDKNSGEAIAIAGVKGGATTEVDENTKNVVIEAANFDPIITRNTARKLKLQTDASKRFENVLSSRLPVYGQLEIVELIQEVAGGTLDGYVDEYPTREENIDVSFSTNDVNKLLGTSISDKDTEDILRRLGFVYEKNGGEYLVTPPFERLDIRIKEDLIEEVGRVYGYENIPEEEPGTLSKIEINKRYFYAEKIRDILTKEGFTEVYNRSLRDSGEVKLENSLASDKNHVRANLKNGIEESLTLNERNAPLLGKDSVRIFEIGNVFKKDSEYTSVCLGVRGKDGLESAVRKISESLGVEVRGEKGEEIFEFNLTDLLDKLSEQESYENLPVVSEAVYEQFSTYPFVLRDIAVWTPEGTDASEVMEEIKSKSGELLKMHTLFDTFEKEERVSYAFRLVFQSPERTLTDEEINKIMDEISAYISSKEGWEVR